MRTRSKIIHAGRQPFENSGVVNPPVYHASTMLFKTVDDLLGKDSMANPRYRYGLNGTPTMTSLEDAISTLENAEATRLLPSGLAAVCLIMCSFAKKDGHILIPESCYGPTRHMANGFLKRMGVIAEFYDPTCGEKIKDLIKENTVLVFMESPGSLSFEIQDVPAIARICNEMNIPSAIDNCWGNGYHFRPLDLGVDISMQAATKYISGGSDLLLGTIAYNKRKIGDRIHDTWIEMGSAPSADTMFDCMRGLRSMAVRLDYHMQAGIEVGEYLAKQSEIEAIIHPALPSHPQHEIWKRDFKGAPSLFSFVLKTPDLPKPILDKALAHMIEPMQHFKMGFSWGGYESLITPFDVRQDRIRNPWPFDGISIRIHVGQEDINDLKEDIRQALDRWNAALKH